MDIFHLSIRIQCTYVCVFISIVVYVSNVIKQPCFYIQFV